MMELSEFLANASSFLRQACLHDLFIQTNQELATGDSSGQIVLRLVSIQRLSKSYQVLRDHQNGASARAIYVRYGEERMHRTSGRTNNRMSPCLVCRES